MGNADYDLWRDNYGATLLGVSEAGSASVPEPTSIGMLLGMVWTISMGRGRGDCLDEPL